MKEGEVITLPGPYGEEYEAQAIEARIDAGFDPATGRRATRGAIEYAEMVYKTIIDALDAQGIAFPDAREIAEGAYKTALFRHDNPFRR